MAELTNALRMSPRSVTHPKGTEKLDGAIALAVVGVAAIFLFSVKGLLDQVPDVIDSASRARAAWQRFKRAGDEITKAREQPSSAQLTELPRPTYSRTRSHPQRRRPVVGSPSLSLDALPVLAPGRASLCDRRAVRGLRRRWPGGRGSRKERYPREEVWACRLPGGRTTGMGIQRRGVVRGGL